jgi:predicted amidophosphoribosyltransferase
MQVELKEIYGEWDRGYVLDQHSTSSTPDGHHPNGFPKFDTDYTEAGKAVYLLKYQGDFKQVPDLAKAVCAHILPLVGNIDLVIPMAASTKRPRQPVNAVAAYIATMVNVPIAKGFLVKARGAQPLKDLSTRAEKDLALRGTLSLSRELEGDGPRAVLLVDDLFETGASFDAACRVLRDCEKIGAIYVAALTWRRPR